MYDSPPRPVGVLASLQGILDGGLALVENRLELFALELREEKLGLVRTMFWAAAVVVLASMALGLSTVGVVILFWDSARVAALFALSLVYLLGALLAWRGLRSRVHRAPSFSASLGELAKDRAWLRNGNQSA